MSQVTMNLKETQQMHANGCRRSMTGILPLFAVLLSPNLECYGFTPKRVSRTLVTSIGVLSVSRQDGEGQNFVPLISFASSGPAANVSSFGEVVSLKKSLDGPASSASFGDVVEMRKPSSTMDSSAIFPTPSYRPTSAAAAEEVAVAHGIRKRNALVAALSIVLAISNWVWHMAHPLEPIQLLAEMQKQSDSVTLIGRNEKPTIVDFWAPWCENCKLAAPTLRQVEEQYGDAVNFIMVNGDLATSWPYIEAFGVDAIPHLALISAAGDVETALIGPIPKHVLTADLDILIQNSHISEVAAKQDLPFKMLDVFAGKPDSARRVQFDN